jgi:hypothetical protein
MKTFASKGMSVNIFEKKSVRAAQNSGVQHRLVTPVFAKPALIA